MWLTDAHPPLGKRAGFTLVELLIALAICGVVAGTALRVVLGQQRFYRGAADIIDARTALRQAIDILPNELRGLTTGRPPGSANDIYTMSATSIEFRSTFGTSVVCASNGSSQITVPPFGHLKSGSTLSSAIGAPNVGDSLFVYDDSGSLTAAKSAWQPHKIVAVGTSANACNGSGFSSSTDGDPASVVYTVTPNLTLSEGVVGTPVRFFKRERYQLYASTGDWYLGFTDCQEGRAPQCASIQPVSGPYRPVADTALGTSGLYFRYQDSTGNGTATPAAVARIGITVRTQSRSALRIAGWRNGPFTDSLAVVVGLRNRR